LQMFQFVTSILVLFFLSNRLTILLILLPTRHLWLSFEIMLSVILQIIPAKSLCPRLLKLPFCFCNVANFPNGLTKRKFFLFHNSGYSSSSYKLLRFSRLCQKQTGNESTL
jgi:hypothetical protein